MRLKQKLAHNHKLIYLSFTAFQSKFFRQILYKAELFIFVKISPKGSDDNTVLEGQVVTVDSWPFQFPYQRKCQ